MAKQLPLSPAFAGTNEEAQLAAALRSWDARSQKLITAVSNETRENVRNLVRRSIAEGIAPRDAARLIRPMVGLTAKQGQAVMNYRAGLVTRGLTPDRVEKLTERYAAKQLRSRAEMIARTEVMGALNEGQKAAWSEAQKEGLLGPNASQQWLTTDPCPICAPMEGATVLLKESFAIPGPPAHPRCRCSLAVLPGAPIGVSVTPPPRVRVTPAEAPVPVAAAPSVPAPTLRKLDDVRAALKAKDLEYDQRVLVLERELATISKEAFRKYAEWGDLTRGQASKDEILAARSRYMEATAAQVDARKALVALREDRASVLHEALFKEGKAGINAIGLDRFGEGKKDINKGIEFIQKMLGKNAKITRSAVRFEVNTTGRAYYQTGGSFMEGFVSVETKDAAHTVVHELGHWLEDVARIDYAAPGRIVPSGKVLGETLGMASRRYLQSRTAGEIAEPLAELFPFRGYGPQEITKKDKFFHAYVGKIYGGSATEILSMGLEQMYKDPMFLLQKDPDLFKFVLEAMDAISGAKW